MFELLFSFRGRIGRVRYLLTSLGSGVGIVVIVVLGVMSVSKDHPISGVLGLVGLGLLLFVAMMWSSLSLQARRIRDIGWDPTIVIPSVLGLQFFIGFTGGMTGHASHHVSLPVSVAFWLVLLCWPGQRDDDDARIAAVFGDEPDDRYAPAYATPTSFVPAPGSFLPAPGRPAPLRPGAPRKQFGKRGLA